MVKDEHQAKEILTRIEILFQIAINELKENQESEIDFTELLSLIEIYSKFYELTLIEHKRWREYTEELVNLLQKNHEDAENTIKKLIEADKALEAYQKAQTSNSGYEE